MLPDSDDDTLEPAPLEAAHEERSDAGFADDTRAPAEDPIGEGTSDLPAAASDAPDPDLGATPADAALTDAAPAAPPDAVAPAAAAALPVVPVPLPPPPQPKPKPPIRPGRVVSDSGETSYRTDGILIERAQGRACFITISPPQRPSQRIYVHAHAFEQLLRHAEGPVWESGRLWKALCEIPLDRPLPSRRLEEELRALLTTFAGELSR